MSNNYKIKELRIQIKPGVTLIAEVADISEVKALLAYLAQEGFEPVVPSPPSHHNRKS